MPAKVCKTKCFSNAEETTLVPEGDESAAIMVGMPGQRFNTQFLERFDNVDEFFQDPPSGEVPDPRIAQDIEGTKSPAAPVMSTTSVFHAEGGEETTDQPEKPTGPQPAAKDLVTVQRAPKEDAPQPSKAPSNVKRGK